MRRGRREPVKATRAARERTRADLAARLDRSQSHLLRRLSRAGVLQDLVKVVHATLEPSRVGDAVVAHAAAWLPLATWVLIEGELEGPVQIVAERGAPAPGVIEAIGARVIARGQPFAAARLDRDTPIDGAPAVAAIAFPLVARGRAVGALVGLDRAPASRKPRIAAATLAAWQIMLETTGVALDNALRLQRAEALSLIDDLTQLYNSRFLTQALRRETKRAARSGRPLSLLFIDLDGFKSVNDVHGHLCGSRALVEAANVIRQNARETDVVSRYGGDEFAMLLPDTGTDGALLVGERVRERIAAHEFLSAEGRTTRLTASVGVATLPDVAGSAEELLHEADRAMYRVKDQGKNGLHVAVAEVPSAGGRAIAIPGGRAATPLGPTRTGGRRAGDQ